MRCRPSWRYLRCMLGRMDNLRVSIRVGSLDGLRWRTVVALADTGSSHTALQSSLLRELGVEATGTAPFRHADGTARDYAMGIARVQYEGYESYSRVAFLDDGMEPRLGFINLAEMG